MPKSLLKAAENVSPQRSRGNKHDCYKKRKRYMSSFVVAHLSTVLDFL